MTTHDHTEHHDTDRTVVPLRPTAHTATDDVVDAEVVAEEPRPTFGTRRLPVPHISEETRLRLAEGAVELRRTSAPYVQTGTKTVVRHALYVPAGAAVVAKRVRDTRGVSRYERMLQAAEVAGDWDKAAEWEEREARAKRERHQRRMDWLKAPTHLAKAVAISSAAGIGLLLALGVVLAVADGNAGMVLEPIGAAIDTVRWLWWFGTAYGALLLTGSLGLGGLYLWDQGRKHSTWQPRWAAPVQANPEERDLVPDEGAIVSALRELGYAPLTRAFKEGWQPRWVSPTTRVGRGWHTQLLLPRQVPVEEIAKRKHVLAHNLLRKPIEVWPTEPKDQPGVLDLWVADQGILTGPVDPWPLLHEGTTDYFKGVPVAVDVRGEQVTGQLMARNYLVAGIMGSGKSSLVICLLLGAMLDPLVDIDVHVLAYNVDYDPMTPRLRSLVKGDDEEHIEAAMTRLRELASEVSERGRILEALGGEEAKVTRELAEADTRLRPTVVVFDEVQELFTPRNNSKDERQRAEEAKELALKVTKKARKTAITLLWVTPDADATSLPRGISKTASNRVAFAINDHQGNDAILGTGMHKRGYSATTLVAGEDVGTAMAAGFAKVPGLIRSHYVRKEKGVDEITPVVERAVALREQAGLTTGPAPAVVEPAAEVDPLADIAAVLGQQPRMKTREVLQHLTERNRTVYGDWTPQRLTSYLDDYDAAPYKTEGAMQVSAARVHEALTERDRDHDGDTEPTEGDD
ncbi:FtsK/SpoIIIE domain-containing protein [Saccharomonospora halophila]|uniref:FtsK/SpoIIIE domain-containing protein n=1 Tax=Saccharomonospora halophila TaxID=129922 RepID=UPI00036D60F5|nr:FtsK/SpoIIIE domain-containing protein [Saccharomonospora halophila]